MKTTHGTIRQLISGLTAAGALVLAPAAHAHGKGWAEHEFKMMDTNGDGKISADEHAAGAKKMFDMMDADHDGKVTATEMTAAHEKVTGEKPTVRGMPAAEKIKAVDS